MTTDIPPANPKVFISYSHDSRAHCDQVLQLSQQLRRDGVDAELDQFHQEELLHWPRWCEEQMRPENADFVLCVCTAEYARRVENRTAADVGRGVFWEGQRVYNEIYHNKGNRRFLPVLLDEAGEAEIPKVLEGYTWFRLDCFRLSDTESDYARLYRLLTRQANVAAEALGSLVVLPPLPEAQRETDFGGLIEDIHAGVARIETGLGEHRVLLERIDRAVRGYRYDRALHQLKSPPQHFTGRAGPLAEICVALTPKTDSVFETESVSPGGIHAVVISAVNGLGGVGKTALAIMAGYALLDDYPDLQLFLELGAHSANPLTAEQVRDSVLQAVDPTNRLPDDDSTRWQLYRGLFRAADTGKALRGLVVLDDAADDAQVGKLAPPPGCALLVTARQRLRTGQPLHLDRLPRAESLMLLHAYSPRLDETQADPLARLCGDLPVALKTAGGYLKAYPSTPVAEYLEELAQDRLQGLHNEEEPLDDVNRVFDASYRRLGEPERRAFAALAVMPIDFDREAGKAVVEATRPEGAAAAKSLDRLVHLNLLDYDEDRQRYGWHDLLRDYALARLPEDEAEAARLGHAEHFTQIGERADELYLQGHGLVRQGLELFDRERGHLEAAFTFLAHDPRWAERVIWLIRGAAYTSDLHFSPHQRIQWLEAQATAARRVGDRKAESGALCNLGRAYFELGEPRKAIKYHGQSLGIDREIGDRRGEGVSLGNMGIAYTNLSEPLKAIECHEQALAIAQEIGYRRGECFALGGLGNAYAILGKLHEAIEYHEQRLTVAREIGDRYGEGYALGGLGNAYYSQGDPRKAIGYFEQALAIAREIGDRLGEAMALGNLGMTYRSLGEPRKAIGYYQQHLVIHREIRDRRGEGNDLWNSALAYEELGERAQALPLAQQALAILEAIENPNVTMVRETLAQWQGGDESLSKG